MCSARRLPHLSWSLPVPSRLSLSLSLSVSKQDFRVSTISLTHISSLFPLLPFPICIPTEGFFAPQLFLSLSLSLSLFSALNVPNSRENGRAIETAQQKKVIIKLAPKMTLGGRTDPFLPSAVPLFGPFSLRRRCRQTALNFRGGRAVIKYNSSSLPPPASAPPAERGRKEC